MAQIDSLGRALASALFILLLSSECSFGALRLQAIYPAGGQIGASVPAEAVGSFDRWPPRIWVDRPGLTINCKADKGQLDVVVASDAPPGLYWIRMYDDLDASSPVPFLVGYLPENLEVEPNGEAPKAQQLTQSVAVVNGRLAQRGDVDTFSVPLKQGQTLVAAIEANRTLGAPMDAVLQMLTHDGFVLLQNDDDQGLDPRLIFTAPRDGNYLARVFAFPATPDQTIAFAGGAQSVYRLTLTTEAFVDFAMPLAVERGHTTPVRLSGWNLPDDLQELALDAAPAAPQVYLSHPRLANALSITAEPHPSLIEMRSDAQPISLSLPVTVTGLIELGASPDEYAFAARESEKLVFTVESRTLGYPLDPVLEVVDAQSKSLLRVDDTGTDRDAVLEFTAPANGEYRLRVSDLHGNGGPRYVYRLRACQADPDYKLSLTASEFSGQTGSTVEVVVNVERLHGFAEEIEIQIQGLPAAQAASAVSASSGDSATVVKFALPTGGQPFSGPLQVLGTSRGEKKRRQTAQVPVTGRQTKIATFWFRVFPPKVEAKS